MWDGTVWPVGAEMDGNPCIVGIYLDSLKVPRLRWRLPLCVWFSFIKSESHSLPHEDKI